MCVEEQKNPLKFIYLMYSMYVRILLLFFTIMSELYLSCFVHSRFVHFYKKNRIVVVVKEGNNNQEVLTLSFFVCFFLLFLLFPSLLSCHLVKRRPFACYGGKWQADDLVTSVFQFKRRRATIAATTSTITFDTSTTTAISVSRFVSFFKYFLVCIFTLNLALLLVVIQNKGICCCYCLL